jgi:hypothetical protein
MNIAFYANDMNSDKSEQIFNCLNETLKNEQISDASLFFNNPGPINQKTDFGIFNATELWAYTGVLINTTIQCALYSLGVVNKFKPAYLFSKDRDIMGLINIINKMPVLVTNKEDEQEVYRLTGKKPKLVELKAESLIEVFQ